MQKTEEQLKAGIVNELQLEQRTAKEIADLFDVPYSKVIRIQGQYKAAVANNTVNEFLNTERLVLDRATELLSSELPSIQEEIAEAKSQLSKKLTIMEQLNDDLAVTAQIANNKLRTFIAGADTAGELSTLVDSLCTLRNSFFNKNITQVNIQNNAATTGGYNWGSDVPGAVVDAN